MLEHTLSLPYRIDVRRTLSSVRRGSHDPTCRFEGDLIWRASRFPSGSATLRLHPSGPDELMITAWGDGAAEAIAGVGDLIGCNDDSSGFEPEHPLVARLWRDHGDVRIPRTAAVTETLINVVLEQRVTIFEARRAQHQLVARWGEPAPGPVELMVPPDPEVLAGVAYYDLHVIGVERSRADTVRRVAASRRQLDAIAEQPLSTAQPRLQQIPGVGAWSAAEVALVALGDADAVPVGDVHLPTTVTYALTGTAVDDDEAMLEALEPFAGHRGRVIRLLQSAGVHAPRHGPRYAPRDWREH